MGEQSYSWAITDDFINDYLNKHFFSYFKRTTKIHNDFWYIWIKSGLLDYVCLKLRKKYDIAVLDGNKDYQCGEVPVNDIDTVSIETHTFYDEWERKEEFTKELKALVYQLRLHRSAFWFLFDRIFYDFPLDIKWKWEAMDHEAIHNLIFNSLNEFYIEGFTRVELKEIKSMLQVDLGKSLGRSITDQEAKEIDIWCDKLKRHTRSLTDMKLTLRVIQQMKRYKKKFPGYDDDHNFSNQVRVTSERAADAISSGLDNKEFFSYTYRQEVKSLYKKFPILREFIASLA